MTEEFRPILFPPAVSDEGVAAGAGFTVCEIDTHCRIARTHTHTDAHKDVHTDARTDAHTGSALQYTTL